MGDPEGLPTKMCCVLYRYFMVPDQLQPRFCELGEDSWDNLETELSERFERLMQNSKTNTFDAEGLKQHIGGVGHKSHSQSLRKALEEIAVSLSC